MKRRRSSVEQIPAGFAASRGRRAHRGCLPPSRDFRPHVLSLEEGLLGAPTYDGMPPNEARELNQLRDENTKLKRLVPDLSLNKVMLQDVVQKRL